MRASAAFCATCGRGSRRHECDRSGPRRSGEGYFESPPRFLPFLFSPPNVLIEDSLAHPDALRGDLDELVRADILYRPVQSHRGWRGESDGYIAVARAHVGEVLQLADVDFQIGLALVLADD